MDSTPARSSLQKSPSSVGSFTSCSSLAGGRKEGMPKTDVYAATRSIFSEKAYAQETRTLCDECMEPGVAETYCRRCVRRLCRECSLYHRRSKITHMHQLVRIEEQEDWIASREQACSTHPDYLLKFYCETCNVMCCRECLTAQHSDHTYKLPIGGLSETRRQQTKEQIQELHAFARNLQEQIEELCRLEEQLQERQQGFAVILGCQHDFEFDVVKAPAEKLQAVVAIRERRATLMKEVDSFTYRHRQALDKKRQDLASIMVSTWKRIEMAESMLIRGASVEAASKLSVDAKDLTELSQESRSELEDMKTAVSGINTLASDLRREVNTMRQEVLQARRETGVGSALLAAEVKTMSDGLQEMRQAISKLGEKVGNMEAIASIVVKRKKDPPTSSSSSSIASWFNDQAQDQEVVESTATSSTSEPQRRNSEPLRTDEPKEPKEQKEQKHSGESVQKVPIALASMLFPSGASSGVHVRGDEDIKRNGLGKLRLTIGNEGGDIGNFRSPCGITVDSHRLYVADTLNHRIQVFDRRSFKALGKLKLPQLDPIAQQADAPLDPSGLCVIDDNHLCAVSYGMDWILEVNVSKEVGQLECTACYMLDGLEMPLYGPYGVYAAHGKLLLADSCNHRCLLIDLATKKVIKEFGSQGDNPGQFSYCQCSTIMSDGWMAISDKNNHRVQIFDQEGTFQYYIPVDWTSVEAEAGRTSHIARTGVGRLNGPMGMAVDRRDRLYICDCGNDRVQIFTRHGQFLWSSKGAMSDTSDQTENAKRGGVDADAIEFRSPTGMCIDKDGQCYVASDHCIQIFA